MTVPIYPELWPYGIRRRNCAVVGRIAKRTPANRACSHSFRGVAGGRRETTMSDEGQMHVGLERIIAPRLRVGFQVTFVGAVLLIFFLPRYGVASRLLPDR